MDGEVIDEPQFKVTTQKVELDPEAKATAPEPVTILLHAPVGMDAETAMASISAETLSEEHRFSKRPLKGHFLRLTAQRRPASQGQRPCWCLPRIGRFCAS